MPLLPAGSIFLVVVDPGSARRAAARRRSGAKFVAPDNGVLSIVFGETRHAVVALSETSTPPTVSRTFEDAIDLPAAAWLATGIG